MVTLIVQLLILSCAYAAALLAQTLQLPLPWLVGPLFLAMLFQSMQIKMPFVKLWRQGGQWIIGTGLGTYFTPAMLLLLSQYAGLFVTGIIWALLLGAVLAAAQYRYSGVSWTTAWFASSMGGASEMVNLAERYQARADLVAAAHSLRLVLLVMSIPLFLQYVYQIDFNRPIVMPQHQSLLDTLILLGISGLGAYIANKLNLLNAWVLGPLGIVALLTACGVSIAQLPTILVCLGQILIGWSLGSKFPFATLKQHPRFLGMTLVLNIVAMLMSLSLAFGLSQFVALDSTVLLLGLVPGGIAEMSLTAKTLHLAVPIVVAFQLTRLIVVLLTSKYFYHLGLKYLNQKPG